MIFMRWSLLFFFNFFIGWKAGVWPINAIINGGAITTWRLIGHITCKVANHGRWFVNENGSTAFHWSNFGFGKTWVDCLTFSNAVCTSKVSSGYCVCLSITMTTVLYISLVLTYQTFTWMVMLFVILLCYTNLSVEYHF